MAFWLEDKVWKFSELIFNPRDSFCCEVAVLDAARSHEGRHRQVHVRAGCTNYSRANVQMQDAIYSIDEDVYQRQGKLCNYLAVGPIKAPFTPSLIALR